MMLRYRDYIEFNPEMTLGEADAIEEYLRGIGFVEEKTGRGLRFFFDCDDLWDVCERAYEVSIELSSRGLIYTPEKSNIEEVVEA